MKLPAILAALVFVTASSLHATSLTFTLPANATLEDKKHGDLQFYVIKLGDDRQPGLLMVSSSPAPITFEMLKPMAEMMRISVLGELKKQASLTVDESQTTTRDFAAGIWKGYEISLRTSAGDHQMSQLIFVLWDGESAWNGQFTGSPDQAATAVEILSSAKKVVAPKPAN